MREIKDILTKLEDVLGKIDKLAIIVTQIDPDAIASLFPFTITPRY